MINSLGGSFTCRPSDHCPRSGLQTSGILVPSLVRLSPMNVPTWSPTPSLSPPLRPSNNSHNSLLPFHSKLYSRYSSPWTDLLKCPQIHFQALHSSFPSSILPSTDHSAGVCTSRHGENAGGLLLTKGRTVDKA